VLPSGLCPFSGEHAETVLSTTQFFPSLSLAVSHEQIIPPLLIFIVHTAFPYPKKIVAWKRWLPSPSLPTSRSPGTISLSSPFPFFIGLILSLAGPLPSPFPFQAHSLGLKLLSLPHQEDFCFVIRNKIRWFVLMPVLLAD